MRDYIVAVWRERDYIVAAGRERETASGMQAMPVEGNCKFIITMSSGRTPWLMASAMRFIVRNSVKIRRHVCFGGSKSISAEYQRHCSSHIVGGRVRLCALDQTAPVTFL